LPRCYASTGKPDNPRATRSGWTSGAASEFARLGVHLHALPFFDEEWHADLQARFKRGELGNAAAGRVSTHAWLCIRDGQLHVRWQLETDRPSIEPLDVHADIVSQQLCRLADGFGAEGDGFKRVLVHEIEPGRVGIEIRGRLAREVRLPELVSRFERL